MSSPRIYVACLASYNNGVHHGAWIDLEDLDEDDLRAEIATILRTSPYPNVMVDCPGCPGGDACKCTKCPLHDETETHPAFRRVCWVCKKCVLCNDNPALLGHGQVPSAEEWAVHDYDEFGSIGDSLGEHPALGDLVLHATMLAKHEDAWEAYVQWGKGEFTEEDFDECYRGHYDSPGDFAEEFITDVYDLSELPQVIRFHVDWDGIARDMRLGGDQYFSEDDGPCHVFDNY